MLAAQITPDTGGTVRCSKGGPSSASEQVGEVLVGIPLPSAGGGGEKTDKGAEVGQQ